MGVNDAKEMLEAAQAECIRLEREMAGLREEAFEMEHRANRRIREVEAERDAALAVIEQVREWADAVNRWAPNNLVLEDVLSQSPASALAKVKADALREAVERFESGDVAPDDLGVERDGVRWAPNAVEGAWEYQGPIMDWLRDEADRLEKSRGE